jgi:hypothetical protein
MSTTQVIVLILVLVLFAAAALAFERTKRNQLRRQFGQEYDRTVEHEGGTRAADKELSQRTQRHDKLEVRALRPEARDAYAEQWRETQEHFVDEPRQAVREADVLVARVLQERGYPVGDFDQQARDVSVEHADLVGHYRSAHDVFVRNEEGAATTEELRAAMVHYRELFADLLVQDGTVPQQSDRHRTE